MSAHSEERIKLEEIKTHPFVKMGEGLMGRDNLDLALTDKRVVEYVMNQMNELGFDKLEVRLNVDNNKHIY